jgi:hypothetical protein
VSDFLTQEFVKNDPFWAYSRSYDLKINLVSENQKKLVSLILGNYFILFYLKFSGNYFSGKLTILVVFSGTTDTSYSRSYNLDFKLVF